VCACVRVKERERARTQQLFWDVGAHLICHVGGPLGSVWVCGCVGMHVGVGAREGGRAKERERKRKRGSERERECVCVSVCVSECVVGMRPCVRERASERT